MGVTWNRWSHSSIYNKNDANNIFSGWYKIGFEIKNEIEGQCQSSPKFSGILRVLRCILGPDLEILSWIGGEWWHGQVGILTKVFLLFWSKFSDCSLNGWQVIARTNKWLPHTQTDVANDNTRRPKLASGKNWGRYKLKRNYHCPNDAWVVYSPWSWRVFSLYNNDYIFPFSTDSDGIYPSRGYNTSNSEFEHGTYKEATIQTSQLQLQGQEPCVLNHCSVCGVQEVMNEFFDWLPQTTMWVPWWSDSVPYLYASNHRDCIFLQNI